MSQQATIALARARLDERSKVPKGMKNSGKHGLLQGWMKRNIHQNYKDDQRIKDDKMQNNSK